MSATEILETFRSLPLLSDQPAPLLEQLTAISTLKSYRPREVVAAHDEPVRGIHVVRAGTVLLEGTGRADRVVHNVRAGSSFGELLTLQEVEVYGWNATATEYGTEVIEIAAEPFRALFASQPEFPVLMVGALSEKILEIVDRVAELSVTCATTRLARHLLNRPKRDVGDVQEVDLGVDRKDLAAILAITPEHLSRLLRRWADGGLVRPLGRTIAILRPDLLATMADLPDPQAAD